MPQGIDGPRFCLSQMSLEFGEGHLDRIEVGAVGRQVEEPCAALLEDRGGLLALVAGEVVEDHHVAWLQRWSELGFDPGLEDPPVHRAVDHPGGGQPVMPQPGDERLGAPVTEGSLHLQPLPPARPAPQAGHLGSGAGLIDEHQPFRAFFHPRLAMLAPHPPRVNDVSAMGLAGQQSFF